MKHLQLGFLAASLCLNVAVLVPICIGLYRDAERMKVVFGRETPARGILKAVYSAILLVSTGLLCIIFIEETSEAAKWMATALLLVQIVYKLLTPFTTRGGKPERLPANPVVLSNLGIAAFHSVTLMVIFF
eukprot:CAMPEP_0197663132 /NCGR_PEP_ID=MMETSP1338-20131121/56227_1 /TAXON_ID=43686 ORGANISM="Pelagodinium beii, Strain RCC1491" /NCGR_SAMPLE_ID=MMETSP1338 /ASSEMBLY_ACC=CAM_ASM_000754 /LENGTH=130 /DNA_ID=CAMNT_0043241353 /DNA_START=53 /DNA_END=442 /DNA_ORIENTATION=+